MNWIPIDRSRHALQLCFWLRPDRTRRSAAKRADSVSPSSGHSRNSGFAAKRSLRLSWTQKKFERAFKVLTGHGQISEINVAETLKEVRRALLDADVNFKTAKDLVDEQQRAHNIPDINVPGDQKDEDEIIAPFASLTQHSSPEAAATNVIVIQCDVHQEAE